MTQRIDRRTALSAGTIALVGSFGGCLDSADESEQSIASPTSTETPVPTPAETGTYAVVPDGPKQYPDRPTSTDRDAALGFAREFERVHVHNSLHESDIEDLYADSTTAYDVEAHGGHYVLATGSGYANYADGVHADWGQAPAIYFVSPDLAVRAEDLDSRYFDCEEVFAAESPEENFAGTCSGDDASYRAYNLHPSTRTLTVTVDFLAGDEVVSVLQREYDLATGTGVLQESVTYRRGTYRVTASLPGGPSTTAEWTLESAPAYDDPPLTVIVTPVDDVRIRRPPFPAL